MDYHLSEEELDHLEALADQWADGEGYVCVAEGPAGWLTAVVVDERDGRLVVREVHVLPGLTTGRLGGGVGWPAAGLSARDLRQIKLSFAVQYSDSMIANPAVAWTILPEESLARLRDAPPKQRGKARDDEFHAVVADGYLWALRMTPTRPNATLARYLADRGRPDVSAKTAGEWAAAAGRHGWLTKGRVGGGGRQATQKLLDWQAEKKGADNA